MAEALKIRQVLTRWNPSTFWVGIQETYQDESHLEQQPAGSEANPALAIAVFIALSITTVSPNPEASVIPAG